MSRSEPISSIKPTQEAGRRFVQRGFSDPVAMLNPVKFRDVADYLGHPELAPAIPITGAASLRSSASHAAYLAGLGHRVAAVADSRLLPLSDMPPTGTDGSRP